jgi:hypothetical protein
MTKPNRCPACGELVSMFAAGCAICGAELDPFRAQQSTLAGNLRSAWSARPRLRPRIRLKSERR